jgi:O-antigen ligase
MNRELLDRWCERGILSLVLAILLLMPLAFGGRPQMPAGIWLDFLLLNPFLAAQWLTVGVVALWLIRIWLGEGHRLLWPPICWAVLAFTAYAIGRYLTSDIEYVARQELIQVLVYAFVFFAVLNNLHRQETTQIISYALVILAVLISFVAVYQFLKGSDRVWYVMKPYPHRGSGTYISPNHLGGFLEMVLPLGLAYTLMSRLKPLPKVFLAYSSITILAGIAVTLSRGSWIATALALSCFFGVLLFHRTYRLPAFVLLLLLLSLGFLLIPRNLSFEARFRQLLQHGKVDDDQRFALWQPALKVWRENIWWGAGPAHFDYRFRAVRPEEVQSRPDRAHNDFLNTLADWGIVGAALVSSAWLLLAIGVAQTRKFVRSTPSDLGENKGSNKYAFVLGASVGLIAILAHSAVDFNMHIPANALVAVALMALLSSHLRFTSERYWLSLGVASRVAATLLTVAGMIYLTQQSWRQSRENHFLALARQAPNMSAAQVALLERAAAVEPGNGDTAAAIGEALRIHSQEGGEYYAEFGGTDYRHLAQQAMDWFQRGMKLNPWDSLSFLGYGWCLDQLGRSGESGAYFDRASRLDPNGYYTMAKIGLHYVELLKFAAAKPWLERSLRLQDKDNSIAESYLGIVNARLMEAATNEITPKLEISSP